MKNAILYTLIIVAACIVPLRRQDVADLEPIAGVWLRCQGDQILLTTDTRDTGSGATVAQALQDLQRSSPGIVYLDTASVLLVQPDALGAVAQLRPELKGSVRVVLWNGEGRLEDAVRYCQTRKTGILLRNWRPEMQLPALPEKIMEEPGKMLDIWSEG